MPEKRTENVAGAIIFFSYILAALTVTAFIARDLFSLYKKSHDVRSVKHRSMDDVARRRDCAQILIALSLISFAALSYQMLKFLILSYVAWSKDSENLLPTRLWGITGVFDLRGQQTPLQLWAWSKQSSLFQTFAETIVDNPQRYWWTQQALLYSLGWNIFMTVEGARCQIPHLWAYFVLGQILPISFTQNLFCAATFISQNIPQPANMKPAAPGDQFVLILLYLLGLSTAPTTVGTPRFSFILFGIRALLLAPFWMLMPVVRSSSSVAQTSSETVYWHYRFSALVLAVGGVFLHIRQTQSVVSIVEAVRAVNDNPAIAALGYDYLIAVSSLFVFIALRKLRS